MEGNYLFQWNSVSADGCITSKGEQTIFGYTLPYAIKQFESLHGTLSPNEDDSCLHITAITWQP